MSSEFSIKDATLETCHCRRKFHLLRPGSAEVWAKVKSHCSGKKVRSAILGFSSLTRDFCLVRFAAIPTILRFGAGKVAEAEVEKMACCAAAVVLYPRPVLSEIPITQQSAITNITNWKLEVHSLLLSFSKFCGLTYWMLKFYQTGGTLARPISRQYGLINGEASQWWRWG